MLPSHPMMHKQSIEQSTGADGVVVTGAGGVVVVAIVVVVGAGVVVVVGGTVGGSMQPQQPLSGVARIIPWLTQSSGVRLHTVVHS